MLETLETSEALPLFPIRTRFRFSEGSATEYRWVIPFCCTQEVALGIEDRCGAGVGWAMAHLCWLCSETGVSQALLTDAVNPLAP